MLRKTNLNRLLMGIAFACLILILFSRFQYSLAKIFDPDEMTHLHTTYLITQGILPFRDFLWGHLPFFNFLLFPLFKLLPEGPTVLIFSRILIFLINCGSLFILYKICRKINLSSFASIMALILLLVSPFGFERFFEIRPDIPMIFFLLLSLKFFFDFLSSNLSDLRNLGDLSNLLRSHLFFSGLFLGLANAFLLRGVFAIAIFLVITILVLIKKYKNLKKIFQGIVIFTTGLILPILLTLLFWLLTGTLDLALKNIFYYGPKVFATYNLPYDPWVYLGLYHGNYSYYNTSLFDWFYQFNEAWLSLNQLIWLTALVVFFKHLLTLTGVTQLFFERSEKSSDSSRLSASNNKVLRKSYLIKTGVKFEIKIQSLLFTLLAIAYTISLYSYQVHLPQYWLFITVLTSLLAAEGINFLMKILKLLHPLLKFTAGIFIILFPTIVFLVHSQKQLSRFGKNERQLNVISFVLGNTKKTDRFYDGIGSYVFRPDCSYTGMSTPFEIPKEILKYIIEEIENSRCTGIVWGLYDRIRFWGSGDQDYIKANYAPTENLDVWLPKKTIEIDSNEKKEFKIIKEGYYLVSSSSQNNLGSLVLDGLPITESVFLSASLHTITNTGLKTNVILDYDQSRNKTL